jgi:hypothetical protein
MVARHGGEAGQGGEAWWRGRAGWRGMRGYFPAELPAVVASIPAAFRIAPKAVKNACRVNGAHQLIAKVRVRIS